MMPPESPSPLQMHAWNCSSNRFAAPGLPEPVFAKGLGFLQKWMQILKAGGEAGCCLGRPEVAMDRSCQRALAVVAAWAACMVACNAAHGELAQPTQLITAEFAWLPLQSALVIQIRGLLGTEPWQGGRFGLDSRSC